ncbi:MAG: DMT family transporter [Mesorhizobium sp.]|uniref:DMT family transporter n=1 Tax=Mesorhizobium sp. TaxID=1871066 RepID=UPI000FEA231A|nr:DMT family transporter [Mesorhizobium sp.]RWE20478.1 MAG: DMT family transporter [Mesorhizobium sp.]
MQNRMVLSTLSLCVGVLVFSLQDPLVKAVSSNYPLTQVMATRAIVAIPILIILVQLDVGIRAVRSKRIGMLTLRAIAQFSAYTLYYLAIAALPLADAAALYFMAPLFIMVMAGPYLGERVSGRTLATVVIGLVGVIVMLRPSTGLFDWAALLSLGSAFLYGFSQLMARRIGDTESATVMAFYQNGAYLIGAVLIAGMFHVAGITRAVHPSLEFLVRPWVWPTVSDLMTMAACGFVASAGMILLSQAYRLAPANRVATFEYTGIIWTPLWGLLFFGEVPRNITMLGAALIIGAGLLALNGERRFAKRIRLSRCA